MKTGHKKRRRRFLFIFGTRPEAIKLAPVVEKIKGIGDIRICVTGQHREMLDQVLKFFSLVPDYDLRIMEKDQSLFTSTGKCIQLLGGVVTGYQPDLVLVQGDTTTAFMGALAGYYHKIPVAHVEAGLRSFDKYSPFPEEMNRVLVGRLADYHFAPTENAKKNLLWEGIPEGNIFVVGNTVIDALFMGLRRIARNETPFYHAFRFLDFSKRLILVTGHRRESFGSPFENICLALKELAEDDVEIVYPVHLNPRVRAHVYPILRRVKNIHLVDPLEYPALIWLMGKSYLVLTDSGGIQEEAPSLGKPVLVMREVTERTEGIVAGTAKLVGTDKEAIVSSARMLLNDRGEYKKMAIRKNPYGDGKASQRIRDIVKRLIG